MDTVEILEMFALVYTKTSCEQWEELAEPKRWEAFLRSTQKLADELDSYKLCLVGMDQTTTRSLINGVALREAPNYQQMLSFANSHFTGGLPQSIVPVESCYRPWTARQGCSMSFSSAQGMLQGDSARHMQQLCDQLDLRQVSEPPLPADHLAVQLSFLSLLIELGSPECAAGFIDEHLVWLPAFLDELVVRVPDAAFLVGMTALLVLYVESLRESLRRTLDNKG
ncbi:MAG: molecular chaperone TorD family protein [Coriobacteriales bacterium]|jgi:TorA maturation chaperone TorD|nr:molecular chaperone TorD family protein [Coriobacteriales bacterium]